MLSGNATIRYVSDLKFEVRRPSDLLPFRRLIVVIKDNLTMCSRHHVMQYVVDLKFGVQQMNDFYFPQPNSNQRQLYNVQQPARNAVCR